MRMLIVDGPSAEHPEDDFRYGYCESVEACKQEIHDRFYSGEDK